MNDSPGTGNIYFSFRRVFLHAHSYITEQQRKDNSGSITCPVGLEAY